MHETRNSNGSTGVFQSAPSLRDFYASYGRELAALPGIRKVGFASTLPFGPQFDLLRPYRLLDRPEKGRSPRIIVEIPDQQPAEFETLLREIREEMIRRNLDPEAVLVLRAPPPVPSAPSPGREEP